MSLQPLVSIIFEDHNGVDPTLTEGPFEWIEAIHHNLFGLRPGDNEAEEIAGVNADGTWDAGLFKPDAQGNRIRTHYTRWTITT